MRIVVLFLALAGGQPLIPVSERVPRLDVEAMCRATVATDKAMGLDLPQSYEDCMRDENSALQQLNTAWTANPEALRNRCEGEATAGGSDSYVDLLTCMQMAEWVNSPASAPKLRGAGKNRNKL
jgi:hypothetical protein